MLPLPSRPGSRRSVATPDEAHASHEASCRLEGDPQAAGQGQGFLQRLDSTTNALQAELDLVQEEISRLQQTKTTIWDAEAFGRVRFHEARLCAEFRHATVLCKSTILQHGVQLGCKSRRSDQGFKNRTGHPGSAVVCVFCGHFVVKALKVQVVLAKSKNKKKSKKQKKTKKPKKPKKQKTIFLNSLNGLSLVQESRKFVFFVFFCFFGIFVFFVFLVFWILPVLPVR